MASRKITVKPVAGALGAEIEGVDLGEPLDNRTWNEIHRAFLDHQVIFFRDQHLTPEQQIEFTRRFGPLGQTPFVEPLPGHPEIVRILKQAEERKTLNFGGIWHTDFSFHESPPLGSVLYAREVPPYGGDTLFANMYLAYEALSEGMRQMLDGLIGIHSAVRGFGPKAGQRSDNPTRIQIHHDEAAAAEMEHPVVRTHPETGRKGLFVNRIYTLRFKDMTKEESLPLLKFLTEHAVRPEFTCRFRWRADSLAVWDNRCTQHHALNDYDGFRREMHRTTVIGERPA